MDPYCVCELVATRHHKVFWGNTKVVKICIYVIHVECQEVVDVIDGRKVMRMRSGVATVWKRHDREGNLLAPPSALIKTFRNSTMKRG